jgi:putative ABC transport system permease protein
VTRVAARRPRLFVHLAVQSLARRPARTFLLAATVAVAVGAILAAAIVKQAMQDSLTLGVSRTGADLLVVPRETLVNLTAALLTAEPSPHTLDAHLVEVIARLPGVDAAAPQRYFPLETVTASQVPDVIAFDPRRDFTVLPWLREKLDRPFNPGDALVGARRGESVGVSIPLGARALTVYGRLESTGVGSFDRSVFVTFETAEALAEAGRRASGTSVFDGARRRVSAVLVRLAVGATPDQVRFALAGEPDVKVAASASLYTSVRQMLTAVLGATVVLTLLVVVATVLMVSALYSAVVVERRRELGLLLALGTRPRQLLRLILAEAFMVTGLGGVCGLVLGGAALLLIRRSLGYFFERFAIPFVWPAPAVLALYVLGGLALASCVGPAGAFIPAWRVSRRDPYDLVREEGP